MDCPSVIARGQALERAGQQAQAVRVWAQAMGVDPQRLVFAAKV